VQGGPNGRGIHLRTDGANFKGRRSPTGCAPFAPGALPNLHLVGGASTRPGGRPSTHSTALASEYVPWMTRLCRRSGPTSRRARPLMSASERCATPAERPRRARSGRSLGPFRMAACTHSSRSASIQRHALRKSPPPARRPSRRPALRNVADPPPRSASPPESPPASARACR